MQPLKRTVSMLTTSAAAKNFFMVYRSFGKLYRQFYTNFRPIASNAAVFTLEKHGKSDFFAQRGRHF
jgi:hypothetical protein